MKWGKLVGNCKKCKSEFICDEIDDEAGSDLCYVCFEDALEEYEEKRRERIARENEY